MHKLSALAIAAFLLGTLPAVAGDNPLDTVVVTATRSRQPQIRTGDSLSLISAAQLRAEQTLIVSDALQQTPGLTVMRNGGPGQTTTVSLRGAEAGQTLLLVDGVRFNDPSTVDGEALFGDLMVNNIARIEILRGPQSTLYGSDAIGGVVNILTKRGGETPFAVTASAEGGSFDTYRLNAATNGTTRGVEYGAAVNYFHTNGISAADAANGNSETDGSGNLSAMLSTRVHLDPQFSVDLRGYLIRARTDFDDNYTPPSYRIADSPVYDRHTFLAFYAGANLTLFDGRFRNRLALIGTGSRRTTFNSPSYLPLIEDYAYRGSTRHIEYEGIVDIASNDQITFGAETERSHLASEIAGAADAIGHRQIWGVYLQGQTMLFSQLTLTAGLRHDHDAEFGGHNSLKLAAAWTPNAGATVLRANYGDGFKAPTLYELFSVYANPIAKLAPEIARGWEAGIDQSFWDGRLRASATYFERHTRNLIDFFSCYGVSSSACALRATEGGYYYNVGRSRARGVELSIKAQLSHTLHLAADLTDMHAGNALTHTDLMRRPHIMANGHIQWTLCKTWSLGASVVYVGHRFDGAGDTTPLSSHTTANLYLSHRLGDHVELFGRIENLFDAHYEPVAGYGAPGRAVYVGVRASE